MKNIHILSTDKPSRLLKNLVDGTYELKKKCYMATGLNYL